MKTALQFDFIVNKENKTIHVVRSFAAGLDLVWNAWTKAELLDQWWAPKPWRAQTKSLDFREGGTWIYAMIGPNNETHWSRADYEKIDPKKGYVCLDAFCDSEGNPNPDWARSRWTNRFRPEDDDQTVVDILIDFDKLEDLEKMIQMGFKEGFTMGLGNLDELLEKLS